MYTVLVTGVSRGLGAALFDQLHRRGDRLVGLGRRFTDDQRRLADTAPDRVALLEADLSAPDALPDAGRLRPLLTGATQVALVHNAAVVDPIGPVGTLAPQRLAAAVAVNLTSPMVLTNAVLGALPDTVRRARILFVSSGAAHRAIAGWATYGATKRGAEMFFDVLAAEGDPRVSVANVNPGVMDTGMQQAVRAADFPGRERYVGLHERGELPDPAEVARRIVREHLTDG